MWLRLLPLALFVVLAGFLYRGLSLNPAELPSPLIDKAAPQFALSMLDDQGGEMFSPEQLEGQVWILNVWASWCPSCVAEHALLVDLAKRDDVIIVGLNYKDTPQAATAWLQRYGNPFDLVLDDRDGKVGIDWGVYGAPETFVIDAQGIVRYKHVGELKPAQIETELLPLLQTLRET